MNEQTYSYSDGKSCRTGFWARGDRKPWSMLEVGAVIGGFVVFWPLGLLALYLKHRKGEMWQGASEMQGPWTNWKTPRDAAEHFAGQWKKPNWSGFGASGFTASGNNAFDEYRRNKLDELEALRKKLDEERAAFDEFMRKLRKAKDAEDFERFMAERNVPKAN